jgi:hypothetical protein
MGAALDEFITPQVNLIFEVIPRPVRYTGAKEFPIPLLRYTPVVAELVSGGSPM